MATNAEEMEQLREHAHELSHENEVPWHQLGF